ncbi:MAG TPA: ATP-binding protein [Gammaproteobacteria bacterium]|nr:ATP-binding protein [Gammaproteobacteria bacterium]
MRTLLENNFDRERSLSDLLNNIDQKKLHGSLSSLLGEDMRLVSGRGELIFGGEAVASGSMPISLCGEFEPIGYIQGMQVDAKARSEACISLLELLLCSAKQYYMVSDLHVEATHADYERLLQKNAALLESEARYKALAENLELRVAEQVKTIENAQRQLYQAEKMASVGQLAAGVAHEINNPIGFISSNLNTAKSYVEKLKAFIDLFKAVQGGETLLAEWNNNNMDFVMEDFSELLRESAAGTERVGRIVADLRGFSNIDGADEEQADINHCIRLACNVAAGNVKGHAEIKLELGDVPSVHCQPGRLSQVFLNMLLNASQSIVEYGVIKIQTSVEEGMVLIRISDNGAGIPEDVLPRIFDPFFTTKEVGQGTGLGLSVSHDIIKSHGGRIKVASKQGLGTTFTIYLPAGV